MSTDTTPTRESPATGPRSAGDRWRAAAEPAPDAAAPLLFDTGCRRRLPNTFDRANRYAGEPAR